MFAALGMFFGLILMAVHPGAAATEQPPVSIDRTNPRVTLSPGVAPPAGVAPRDFTLNLVLFECGYTQDGQYFCGLPRTATAPTPAPGPTPDPTTSTTTGTPLEPGATTRPTNDPAPPLDGLAGGPTTPTTNSTPITRARESDHRWRATDHVDDVLAMAVTAFALLALIGNGGLAAAQPWRYRRLAEAREGDVLFADAGDYDFDPDAGGPGDRSPIWRVVSGWAALDRTSRLTPVRVAMRAPLTARIAVDGAYLRAMFGMLWLALPLAAAGLGVSAATSQRLPLPPSFALTAAILVIAIFDATAGLTAVIGFTIALMATGSLELGVAASFRAYLGLAAVWFAIPLIASTARPLRRTLSTDRFYRWDRIGDGLIAALIGGWAVQGAVNGLPGLSGLELPIVSDADRLALLTIAALVARVAVEEMAAYLFPERLKQVEPNALPAPSTARSLLTGALRTIVFAFVALPFVGWSWQYVVGVALFVVPEIVAVFSDRLPNLTSLYRLLPRGVLQVLVMLVVGSLFARASTELFTGDPQQVLRNGFVFLSVPGFVLCMLSLIGRDGPGVDRTRWLEVGGALVVSVSVLWVLQGW